MAQASLSGIIPVIVDLEFCSGRDKRTLSPPRTNGADINHPALFEGALGNVNKSVGLLVLEALTETVTKAIGQGSEGNEILRVFGGDPLCSVLAEGSGGNEELDMGMVNQGA